MANQGYITAEPGTLVQIIRTDTYEVVASFTVPQISEGYGLFYTPQLKNAGMCIPCAAKKAEVAWEESSG